MAINARKTILFRTLTIFGLMVVFACAIIYYVYNIQFNEAEKWKKEATE